MSLSLPGHRPCLTSAFNWFLGIKNDPAVKEPVRQVTTWIDMRNQMVTRSSSERHRWIEIQHAWFKLLDSPKLRKSKWKVAAGPISATILTLKQFGWDPYRPDEWSPKNHDRQGNALRVTLATEEGGPRTEHE